MKRSEQSEAHIQRAIVLALGALPRVIVYRNSVGTAPGDDGVRRMPYGLGPGTPDLLVLDHGRAVGLEVKRPGLGAEPHQADVHAAWRAAGAFACVVHSADEALAALERARRGELE